MSSPELNSVMADPNGAVDRIEALEEENARLRATLLNIQALAERGNPIDATKLADRCRHALGQGALK